MGIVQSIISIASTVKKDLISYLFFVLYTDKKTHTMLVTLKNSADTLLCLILSTVLARVAAEYPCRSGFVLLGNNCYGYLNTRQNWSQAQASCKRLGATLAEPRTHAENIYVKGITSDNGGCRSVEVWLGAQDMVFGYEWASDNSSVSSGYTDWEHSGSAVSGAECMSLYVYYKHWQAKKCDEDLAFVCQYTPKIQPTEANDIVG